MKFNKITKSFKTDIVIIGGELTGLICAYYMTKLNKKVCIIEKNNFLEQNYYVGTSIISNFLDSMISDLKLTYTDDELKKMFELTKDSTNELIAMVQNLNLDCDLIKRDELIYSNEKTNENKIKEEVELLKKYGVRASYINEKNNMFSFLVSSGIFVKDGSYEIDLNKFAINLLKYLQSCNCVLIDNTTINSYEEIDGSNILEIKDEKNIKIKCESLIVTTNKLIKKKYVTNKKSVNIVSDKIEKLINWEKRCNVKNIDNNDITIRATLNNCLTISELPNNKFSIISDININKSIKTIENFIRETFSELDFYIKDSYVINNKSTKNCMPIALRESNYKSVFYCLTPTNNELVMACGASKIIYQLMLGEKSQYYIITSK